MGGWAVWRVDLTLGSWCGVLLFQAEAHSCPAVPDLKPCSSAFPQALWHSLPCHTCGALRPGAQPCVWVNPRPICTLPPRVPAVPRSQGWAPLGPSPVCCPRAGHANASFCPHGSGCRSLVLCEGRAVLDVTDRELSVTVRVPEGRWLWLVSLRTGVSGGHLPVSQRGGLPSQPACLPLGAWGIAPGTPDHPRRLTALLRT